MIDFAVSVLGLRVVVYQARERTGGFHVHGIGKRWDGARYTCTAERLIPGRYTWRSCQIGFAIDCILESGHGGDCISSVAELAGRR